VLGEGGVLSTSSPKEGGDQLIDDCNHARRRRWQNQLITPESFDAEKRGKKALDRKGGDRRGPGKKNSPTTSPKEN